VSVPIPPANTPKAEGPSRSQRAHFAPDKPSNGAASFATFVERGLNGSKKVEPRTRDGFGSESEKDVDRGEQADRSETDPSDGLQHAHLAPDTECGKGLPRSERARETTPEPFSDAQSASAAAVSGESGRRDIDPYRGVGARRESCEIPVAGEWIACVSIGSSAAALGKQPGLASMQWLLDPTVGDPVTDGGDGLAKQPIEKDTAAANAYLEKGGEAEPKKDILDVARNGMSEKSSYLRSLASLREREQGLVPARSEHRGDARPETVPAIGPGPQALGGDRLPSAAPMSIPSPVATAEWLGGLGNQIRWMISHQSPVAELKLSPPGLGNMEIRIALDKDAASIQFVVHDLAAKNRVEEALPRLRALLGDVGVNLQDVGVEGRTGSEHRHNAHSGLTAGPDESFTKGTGKSRDESGQEDAVPRAHAADRMIDAYA